MFPPQRDGSKSYKILIVEDEGLVAEMVTKWCRRALTVRSPNGVDVPLIVDIQWTSTCHMAEQRALEWRPDLVVMDIGLPDGCGARLAIRLREKLPPLRMLGFSALKNERAVWWADRAGLDGFVLKSPSGARELGQALAAVVQGESYFMCAEGEIAYAM